MTAPMMIKVEGLAELRKALLALPKELHKGPLARAVAAAAIVVRNEARQIVPILKSTDQSVLKRRKPGTLRNAIRVGRSRHGSSAVQEMYNVFVRRLSKGQIRKFREATGKSGKQNPDDPFYWTVWEFGNGVNASRPFMRPAFDSKVSAAIAAMAAQLKVGIERVAKKVAWGKPKS